MPLVIYILGMDTHIHTYTHANTHINIPDKSNLTKPGAQASLWPVCT